MIRLKNITIRNFLSVGNVTQAVNLENPNLTLVLGENLDLGGNDAGSRNGVGKTTLANAISYALYGQALSNIKKDNLINRTNEKGMLITLEFDCNGQTYRIERGRKPAVMRFFVGDREQKYTDDAQGDSRETQQEIDRLLNMSHDMFRHIVALNTYTEPFLSLRANDQRVIIEQLLGITLLSEKADQLKELNRNVKDLITQEDFRIRAQVEFNQKIQDQIAGLKLKQTAWCTKQENDVARLNKEIAELEKLDINQEIANHAALAKWEKDSKELTDLETTIKTLSDTLAAEVKRAEQFEKQLKTLKDHRCPECDQALHNQKNLDLQKEKTQFLEEVREHCKLLGNEIIPLKVAYDMTPAPGPKPQVHYTTLDEAYTHRTQLNNLQTQRDRRAEESDPYQEQIDELQNTGLKEISYDQVNELQRLLNHQEFLLKILTNKDSFVRKKIIDQNLSYLNQRLSHYLDRIGLPHTVEFQNDLSVSITELGRDLDFDNLSRGERNRLILSLSWAFRDVWESLYQPINFLIVDELIDSGMDTIGVENSLAILKNMARNRSKTVFLISHREELSARVTNILSVVKENGFTTFSQLDNI
jgi:DNA repair exonuclease SbcCD ATPase subunit